MLEMMLPSLRLENTARQYKVPKFYISIDLILIPFQMAPPDYGPITKSPLDGHHSISKN